MSYSSVSARDIYQVFAFIGGFRGWAIECCSRNFAATLPGCHGNGIWDKNGL